jgi:hypothetical protein
MKKGKKKAGKTYDKKNDKINVMLAPKKLAGSLLSTNKGMSTGPKIGDKQRIQTARRQGRDRKYAAPQTTTTSNVPLPFQDNLSPEQRQEKNIGDARARFMNNAAFSF